MGPRGPPLSCFFLLHLLIHRIQHKASGALLWPSCAFGLQCLSPRHRHRGGSRATSGVWRYPCLPPLPAHRESYYGHHSQICLSPQAMASASPRAKRREVQNPHLGGTTHPEQNPRGKQGQKCNLNRKQKQIKDVKQSNQVKMIH